MKVYKGLRDRVIKEKGRYLLKHNMMFSYFYLYKYCSEIFLLNARCCAVDPEIKKVVRSTHIEDLNRKLIFSYLYKVSLSIIKKH